MNRLDSIKTEVKERMGKDIIYRDLTLSLIRFPSSHLNPWTSATWLEALAEDNQGNDYKIVWSEIIPSDSQDFWDHIVWTSYLVFPIPKMLQKTS